MNRTETHVRHPRTHALRHALLSLAVVAGGASVPVFGAAASQALQTPTVHVDEALPGPVATHFAPATSVTSSLDVDASAAKSDAGDAVAGAIIGTGPASYYGHGDGFAGKKTANGETFDPSAMTAAHKTLPLGTRIKVTNLSNHKSVVVRVNDRGPYAKGRILDVSYGAAKRLGMIQAGHAKVRLEKIG